MLNIILQYLNQLPKDYVVMIVGALPISELRGAIPLGLSFGMPLVKAFWLSVLGNCLIVAPALFLFVPVTNVLRRFKIWARFFDWVFERTKKNSDAIQKYEALGLAIFVAIPLPMTGAWSGVIAASLFKIRFRYAFLAIIAGVICAGLIVSALCVLGILSYKAVTT
ncbi:MAG: small multi-drug export protein [Candidatus Omnitrophica bacterium]|nr:small multi-drug export protein [Candidatus Omnitrophota bacterium]MBU4303891.1 small multi-drug export protein [Candidatus Omnitrophota bacterium]MBU4468068.1 small multi-drug export protein [Candidatus Omnitrophota bacterium]MCG2707843.1 small multi-drug export protein [Candidatus Omnitrophota bacterium]